MMFSFRTYCSALLLSTTFFLGLAFIPSQQYSSSSTIHNQPKSRTGFGPVSRSNFATSSIATQAVNSPSVSLSATEKDTRNQHHEQIEEQDHEGEDDDEEDPTETYRLNLELAKLASQSFPRHHYGRQNSKPHPATTAFQLLNNMTHPDTVAYNSVLKAFAKSSPAMLRGSVEDQPFVVKSAAERAQELLLDMIQVHEKQKTANQQWYQRNAMGDLSEAELARGPPRVSVKPNVRSFTTCMDAWSRMGNVAAALRLLKSLQDRYVESGRDIALQPNIFSYNTILSAYAKSKLGLKAAQDALYFCEEIMPAHGIEPDVISYNAVLHAWARSGAPNAGERAEQILRSMPIEPNARSYTTAIDAWSRSMAPTATNTSSTGGGSPAIRAHALLDELKDLYQQRKYNNDHLKPNCVSYSSCIHAYALSKEPLKARRAYQLLQEMLSLGETDPRVLPNRVTYNSVLNACATSSPLHNSMASQRSADDEEDDSEEAGDDTGSLQRIVQTLYHQLISEKSRDSDKSNDIQQPNNNHRLTPDHFTFGTVLKACANNIFWNDPSFAIQVFREACKQGQVSLGVLVQLRQAVPGHVLQELLPAKAYNPRSRQFSMDYVPDSWKRNVRGRERDGGGNSITNRRIL